MNKMAEKIRASFIPRVQERVIRLADMADTLAEGGRRMADHLGRNSREYSDFFTALEEVVAFGKDIKERQDVLTGQSLEDAELAADFAHEVAHVSTLAANLPAILETLELDAQFSLPEGASPEMVQKVVDNLADEIRRAARKGGRVTFGLVIR